MPAAAVRVRVNGEWVVVGGSGDSGGGVAPDEVSAGTTAPTDPAADLWIDTTDPTAPTLKVKDAGGVWVVTAGEIFRSKSGPPPDPNNYRLYLDGGGNLHFKEDEAANPAVWMKVNEDQNEVHQGSVPPQFDPTGATPFAQLWVDTADPSAPVLKNIANGASWQPFPAPAVPDEVFVGATDPYLADPAGTWEVWITPGAFMADFVSSCPNPAAGDKVYSHGSSAQRVWITLGGFIPGNSYTAKGSWIGTGFDATTPATQVAPANGELTWGYYSGSSGDTDGNLTVHDGPTNTDPVCFTSATHQFVFKNFKATWSNGDTTPPTNVAVTITTPTGKTTPNTPHRMEPPAGIVPVEPLTQTTDANGVATWTVTFPSTANSILFQIFVSPTCGAPEYSIIYDVVSPGW